MRQLKRIVILLSLTLFLTACASNSVSDLYEFYEVSSNDDRKLFGYELVVDPTARHSGASRKVVIGRSETSFYKMREELNKYMDVFLYCREGYFVYDESFDGRRYILHGECQESKE